MNRIVTIIPAVILLLIACPFVYSQGELDQQPKVLMRNEQTFGVFLNSNGIGADFQYAKRINARNHTLYRVGLMNVKHPKEIKITNGYYSNKSFVFGKQNYFFALKAQYGHQSELFRKNDAGGLSIRYFLEAGPTIGILKPIYYQIQHTNSTQVFSVVEKFNTSIHQTQIIGKASFFEGFREISLVPGASARVGFTFEYS
ncbi:MAG TPA: hypothetical protein VE870_16740, partial [Bacteroidales bacterium]|nr:hypothetical protein [Bacteroidales bacterium]